MCTTHNVYIGASQKMQQTQDNSVDLVVTSPPYPMIEMWDKIIENKTQKLLSHYKLNLTPHSN